MSEIRWEIPSLWVWVEAKKIAQVLSGGTPKNSKDTDNYSKLGLPWITPADLSGYSSSTISKGKRNLSKFGLANSSVKVIPKGSVLYSSRAPIGYCVIAKNEISTNQGFKSFVPYGGINSRYLRYYLLSAKEYVESKASGTTFLELSGKKAGELTFPIAPLNEQKRIADKIDALMDRRKKAKDALESIPELLNQYSQSILAAAFSGKLTNTDTSMWDKVKLSDICTSISDGDHQALPKTIKGIPFITISAMNSKKIQLDKATRFVPNEYYDNLKDVRKVAKGDVLFSVTGSLAIPALVDFEEPFVFQRHIAIIKPNQEKILSKFLYYIMDSQGIKSQATEVATGTAQLTIPLRGLRSFQILLPPISVQKQIVRAIDLALVRLSNIRKLTNHSCHDLDVLNQSILDKAFRGELVSQDLNDEPASTLLERLKLERTEVEKNKKLHKKVMKTEKDDRVKKMIIPVIEVLKKSEGSLTSQELLKQAGYPHNASIEQVEAFFLDVRSTLDEKKITRARVGDEDVFKLVG